MPAEKVAKDKSSIVRELPIACSDEAKAVEFMERLRWNGHPFCPRCGVVDECKKMTDGNGGRNKRYLWRCYACKRQFTVKVGTVMEDSRIPHRFILTAFWLACASKKGVSALQIKRLTGLSYKSALFLMHRIRFAMASPSSSPLGSTGGTVEADETYVGGKPRYRRHANLGRYRDYKQCVLGFVERGGEIRPVHLERVAGNTVAAALRENVSPRARLMTDESLLYRKIGREFKGGHESVLHSVYEFVRGDAHTNTIEGFFSLLKRGLNGTFHSVSKKHLHRYLSEFQFRYNARKVDDGERTMLAIQGSVAKRLTYRQQVEG